MTVKTLFKLVVLIPIVISISYVLLKGMEYIPMGKLTQHPQCFSGLDELKTDEFYPIEAYRKFYIADKLDFARYKYTTRPSWLYV